MYLPHFSNRWYCFLLCYVILFYSYMYLHNLVGKMFGKLKNIIMYGDAKGVNEETENAEEAVVPPAFKRAPDFSTSLNPETRNKPAPVTKAPITLHIVASNATTIDRAIKDVTDCLTKTHFPVEINEGLELLQTKQRYVCISRLRRIHFLRSPL